MMDRGSRQATASASLRSVRAAKPLRREAVSDLRWFRLMLERAGGRVDVGESPLGGARLRVYLRRTV